MGIGAADSFFKTLKDRITGNKIHEKFKMNILQDGVDYISSILGKCQEINLRSVSQFESRDFCFFLDILFTSDPIPCFKKCLEKNGIPYKLGGPYGDKFVFQVDLESKLVSSGNPHNFFFLDVYSKKGDAYKIRISYQDQTQSIKYQALDKSYHEFNLWVFDGSEFETIHISLNGVNLNYIEKNKKKHKIESPGGRYTIIILLNDFGEMTFFELLRKKRRKN